jgi:UDP-glucose 4-epimerase
MKVLITGGAGYIGTGLVEGLAIQPQVEHITIYDNLSRGNYNFFLGPTMSNAQKVSLIEGDILDSRKLRKHLDGIDVVVHLAAKVSTPFANTDSHFFEQVNHWGTAELVYALEQSSVKRVMFLSSTSVYGRSEQEADEEKTPNPRTFYGISKLRAEEHMQRLFDKMETIIVRCGNVYGYNRSLRFDSVINRFMFDANYKGRLSINGNGTQARAFIDIDTLSKVLQGILFANLESGYYNTVTRNLSVLDLVDSFKAIYPELEFLFINQHLNLRGIKVAVNHKLYQQLEVDIPKDFEQELRAFATRLSFGRLTV